MSTSRERGAGRKPGEAWGTSSVNKSPPSTGPTNPPKSSSALTDPEILGSGALVFGPAIERVLSIVEHADFLMSINDQKFKTAYDFWQQGGWLAVLIVGLLWGVNAWRRRASSSHELTWKVVAAFSFVAFIFGALLSVTVGGGVPRIIASYGGFPVCSASLDTTKLQEFRDGYKIALICYASDPAVDAMYNKNIIVSNLFDIPKVGLAIVTDNATSASQPQPPAAIQPATNPGANNTVAQATPPAQPIPVMVSVNYLAVLVPKDVTKDKITTLSDVERLGGKILDPFYYK